MLLLLPLANRAVSATSNDDLLLMASAFLYNKYRTHLLHADVIGATQLYTLDSVVAAASGKGGDGDVFYYEVVGKKTGKGASAGTSNLMRVATSGASGLALTATTGGVKVLYTVAGPSANYVYVALDTSDADTLQLVKRLNSGLIRINLYSNEVEVVAPGCAVAPMSSSYYTTIQGGNKPIQFDGAGNIIFNGYKLADGTVSRVSGLKRVELPSHTVTALTDDSQTVNYFLAMPSGNVVFEATNSRTTQLWFWKASTGFVALTNSSVSFLLKDSYLDFLFQPANVSSAKVTFARSKNNGGVETAQLPKHTAYAVVGDDGNLYGLDNDSSKNVYVSSILPYQASPSQTVTMSIAGSFPWDFSPPQISKGYLYFVAKADFADSYGLRDVITVQQLGSTRQITLLRNRRFQVYAWRQTGGYDKLYFTARDYSSASATVYSGIIDTQALKDGKPESQYLTLRPVSSAVAAAAEVTDMEILTPQAPVVDPGYAPGIINYNRSDYSEGIVFSKYMNRYTVEQGLKLTSANGTAIAYLPVWFLKTLYLIPDLNGLNNTTTAPLNSNTCYTMTVPTGAKDLWNWNLTPNYNQLSTNTGLGCLKSSLVLYYTFDNGYATDSSGYSNDGQIYNVNFVAGAKGKAAQFQGVTSPGAIRISPSSSLNFFGPVTISYYMRVDDPRGMDGDGNTVLGGRQTVFAKSSDAAGTVDSIYLASTSSKADERFNINLTDGGTPFYYRVSGTSITYKKWVYVTLVFDNGLKIYHNGLLFGQQGGTIDWTTTNSQNLYLGRFSTNWYPFYGTLDELRIYNKALTADEVQNLYSVTATSATGVGN